MFSPFKVKDIILLLDYMNTQLLLFPTYSGWSVKGKLMKLDVKYSNYPLLSPSSAKSLNTWPDLISKQNRVKKKQFLKLLYDRFFWILIGRKGNRNIVLKTSLLKCYMRQHHSCGFAFYFVGNLSILPTQ